MTRSSVHAGQASRTSPSRRPSPEMALRSRLAPKPPHERRQRARVMEVLHEARADRLEIGEHRGRPSGAIDRVEVEANARASGHRDEMNDGVRRAAECLKHGHGVGHARRRHEIERESAPPSSPFPRRAGRWLRRSADVRCERPECWRRRAAQSQALQRGTPSCSPCPSPCTFHASASAVRARARAGRRRSPRHAAMPTAAGNPCTRPAARLRRGRPASVRPVRRSPECSR